LKPNVTIITVTMNDISGVMATVASTRPLRSTSFFRQIIIDSSDAKSAEEIKKKLKDEPYIEYFWQNPAGISAAFNEGIRRADSEWLWFLNGKDEVHPDIHPEHLFYLVHNSTADLIIFRMVFMQSGKLYEKPQFWAMWPPMYNWIPHPATLIRKKLFTEHGYYDETLSIAMDYEFWFRCLTKHTVIDTVSIPIVLFDEDGISSLRPKQIYRENVKIIKKYLRTLINLWLFMGFYPFRVLWDYIKKAR